MSLKKTNKTDGSLPEGQEKQPKNRLKKLKTTKGRNGLMSTGMIAVVVAIVVIFNIAVSLLPSGVRQFDISTSKIYEISDTTKDYLAKLDKDVTITVVAADANIDYRLSHFLDLYTALSNHVSQKKVDPVAYPSALTEYDCKENSVVVQCADTDQSYVISFDDILVPDTYYQYYYNETVYNEFDGEGQLTSAIDSVVSKASHKAYRVTNHSEANLGSEVSALLTKNHFTVSDLSLLMDGGVPDDCEVLILNQPTKDLAKDELKMVQTYLSKGGQVSLILPTESFKHPNLDTLMKEYGLAMAGGYAGDTQRYYTSAQSYLTFFPELNTDSEAINGLTSDDLALVNQALAMKQVDPARDTIKVDAFLTTSESGIKVVSEDDYTKGQYVVAATASEVVGQKERTSEDSSTSSASSADSSAASSEEQNNDITARLTVISANSLIDDSICSQFGDAVCNLTVYMNTVTAAFDGASAISIPSKSLKTATNTVTSAGVWSMLYLIVLPLIALVIGFVVWYRRRKL